MATTAPMRMIITSWGVRLEASLNQFVILVRWEGLMTVTLACDPVTALAVPLRGMMVSVSVTVPTATTCGIAPVNAPWGNLGGNWAGIWPES